MANQQSQDHRLSIMGPFSAADLPLSKDGTIYHLSINREQLSNNILIVGDPDRVPMIANEHFKKTECDVSHRGLRTITGISSDTGQRLSVVTSGMGTPSLEIVFNELMALNEISPESRRREKLSDPINIIRIGTSGALQSDTRLGSSIITSYAVGLDNTGLFYDSPPSDDNCRMIENLVESMLLKVVDPQARFYGKIHPYVSSADPLVLSALKSAAQNNNIPSEVGITVSSSGFFANQGRNISSIPLTVPDIDLHLSKIVLGDLGQRILNMEMEASHLLHFAHGVAYRAGAVCVAIANRRSDEFASNYQEAVYNATKLAISALAELE